MKPMGFKLRFWLGLAVAAIVVVVPTTAQAENVVPNPAFEAQCASVITPIICSWTTTDPMARAAGYSGYGLHLYCDNPSCSSEGGVLLRASTEQRFCAAIGPGSHAASLRYSVTGEFEYPRL